MGTSVFGDFLVSRGKVSRDRVDKALELQRTVGDRLGTNLLELGCLSEEVLLSAIAEQRQAPAVSALDLHKISQTVLRQIPQKMAARYRVVPFELRGKTLSVAGLDPGDLLVEDEIGFLTGCRVKTFVALEVRLRLALQRYYGVAATERMQVLAKRLAGQKVPGPTPGVSASPPSTAPATPRFSSPLAGRPEARKPAPAAAPAEEDPLFIDLSPEDAELLGLGTSDGASLPDTAALDPTAVLPDLGTVPPTDAPSPPAPTLVAPHGSPEPPAADLPAEDRLLESAMALQEAEMRDEIADAVFGFCTPYLRRRLLLIQRKGKILGWRGEGDGVIRDLVRTVEIEGQEPSVFLSLTQGAQHWIGPLPATPPNQRLIEGLGGAPPKDCVALPIALRGKVVAFFYGDNLQGGISEVPIHEVRRLMTKAGVAFEVYILKNKIRVL